MKTRLPTEPEKRVIERLLNFKSAPDEHELIRQLAFATIDDSVEDYLILKLPPSGPSPKLAQFPITGQYLDVDRGTVRLILHARTGRSLCLEWLRLDALPIQMRYPEPDSISSREDIAT